MFNSVQLGSMHKLMHQCKTSLHRHKHRMRRCIRFQNLFFSILLQYASMHNTHASMHNSKIHHMNRCIGFCIDASLIPASVFHTFDYLHRCITACVDPCCVFSLKISFYSHYLQFQLIHSSPTTIIQQKQHN